MAAMGLAFICILYLINYVILIFFFFVWRLIVCGDWHRDDYRSESQDDRICPQGSGSLHKNFAAAGIGAQVARAPFRNQGSARLQGSHTFSP